MKFSRSKMSVAAVGYRAGGRTARWHNPTAGRTVVVISLAAECSASSAIMLDLTDAQQAQIKQIIAKEKPAMEPLLSRRWRAMSR